MYAPNKKTPEKSLHLSDRALDLYFTLYERFIVSEKPITLHLSTKRLAMLTGLSSWEVRLARIELILAGCLHPVNLSEYGLRNVYRFTCLEMKDYSFDDWGNYTELLSATNAEESVHL